MSDDTALVLLGKIIKGLKTSDEFKNCFGDFPNYINTMDQFYPGGKAAYQGSHYRLEETHLPNSTLCFSCDVEEWERDADNREETNSLLEEMNDIGITPSFSEEQQKVDALLNEYGIEHSFIPMREHGEEKRYHSVLVAIDAKQPELLEKLNKFYQEKAHAPLTTARALKTNTERLISAMRSYAAAAGYENPYHIKPLSTVDGNYSISWNKYNRDDPSPELRDKLGEFLVENGLKRLPPPPLQGWDPDGFYLGKLTPEQLAAATARIEFETIELTGHKTVGQHSGSLLAPTFDKECKGRGDKRTLQTLLGMIETSQIIPANTRRRLVTSIQSELNTREIE